MIVVFAILEMYQKPKANQHGGFRRPFLVLRMKLKNWVKIRPIFHMLNFNFWALKLWCKYEKKKAIQICPQSYENWSRSVFTCMIKVWNIWFFHEFALKTDKITNFLPNLPKNFKVIFCLKWEKSLPGGLMPTPHSTLTFCTPFSPLCIFPLYNMSQNSQLCT